MKVYFYATVSDYEFERTGMPSVEISATIPPDAVRVVCELSRIRAFRADESEIVLLDEHREPVGAAMG